MNEEYITEKEWETINSIIDEGFINPKYKRLFLKLLRCSKIDNDIINEAIAIKCLLDIQIIKSGFTNEIKKKLYKYRKWINNKLNLLKDDDIKEDLILQLVNISLNFSYIYYKNTGSKKLPLMFIDDLLNNNKLSIIKEVRDLLDYTKIYFLAQDFYGEYSDIIDIVDDDIKIEKEINELGINNKNYDKDKTRNYYLEIRTEKQNIIASIELALDSYQHLKDNDYLEDLSKLNIFEITYYRLKILYLLIKQEITELFKIKDNLKNLPKLYQFVIIEMISFYTLQSEDMKLIDELEVIAIELRLNNYLTDILIGRYFVLKDNEDFEKAKSVRKKLLSSDNVLNIFKLDLLIDELEEETDILKIKALMKEVSYAIEKMQELGEISSNMLLDYENIFVPLLESINELYIFLNKYISYLFDIQSKLSKDEWIKECNDFIEIYDTINSAILNQDTNITEMSNKYIKDKDINNIIKEYKKIKNEIIYHNNNSSRLSDLYSRIIQLKEILSVNYNLFKKIPIDIKVIQNDLNNDEVFIYFVQTKNSSMDNIYPLYSFIINNNEVELIKCSDDVYIYTDSWFNPRNKNKSCFEMLPITNNNSNLLQDDNLHEMIINKKFSPVLDKISKIFKDIWDYIKNKRVIFCKSNWMNGIPFLSIKNNNNEMMLDIVKGVSNVSSVRQLLRIIDNKSNVIQEKKLSFSYLYNDLSDEKMKNTTINERDEITKIFREINSNSATYNNLSNSLIDNDIVHISTHGTFHEEPCLTYLDFLSDKHKPEPLSNTDVSFLKSNKCSLVFLSACEVGFISDFRDIMLMSIDQKIINAFLDTGVYSVIYASLQVRSDTVNIFIKKFYENILNKVPVDISYIEALKHIKKETNDILFLWSAWEIIGDGRYII